jgi:enoyl-CoA hydratase/carnithine racemase
MELEFVKYEKEKQVVFLTLNRPDRLNAIGPEIYRDLTAALDEAESDDDVKVIVFKGAGRAFSAGADLTGVGYVYGMKDPKSGEKGKQRIPIRVKLNSTGASFWISTEEFSIVKS